jgi:hypothetical protein
VIVGPALIDAYLLESTVAKYPRIVVADGVLGRVREALQTPLFRPALVEDRDTLWVLDLFSTIDPGDEPFVNTIRDRLARAFDDSANEPGIRAKLGWLKTFMASRRPPM